VDPPNSVDDYLVFKEFLSRDNDVATYPPRYMAGSHQTLFEEIYRFHSLSEFGDRVNVQIHSQPVFQSNRHQFEIDHRRTGWARMRVSLVLESANRKCTVLLQPTHWQIGSAVVQLL